MSYLKLQLHFSPFNIFVTLMERSTGGAVNQNEFGKFGVIRDESFFSKQR